jgi:hypothetical protein
VAAALLALTTGAAASDELDTAGARVTFGRAFVEGLDAAWYERIEIDATAQLFDADGEGPMVGLLVGIDAWAGETDGFGFGFPTSLYVGARSWLAGEPGDEDGVAFFATGTVGADCLIVDNVRSETGVGLLAPLLMTQVGVDVSFLRLLAEGGVQYRWQWGGEDRLMYLLGGALGVQAEL